MIGVIAGEQEVKGGLESSPQRVTQIAVGQLTVGAVTVPALYALTLHGEVFVLNPTAKGTTPKWEPLPPIPPKTL